MDLKIKITTSQIEYKGKSIFDRAADELMITESFSDFNSGEEIVTPLYGKLSAKGEEITVEYDEDGEGMCGVHTQVKFNKSRPNELSIVRTGDIDTFMYFEEGKRHVCVYNTGIMPFEICIFSKTVENLLLETGVLELVYLIEIKGACAQRTTFKMEIDTL